MLINGVLVQDATPLEGGGGHQGRSKSHPFPEKGPLKLQDHGNPVRYRNIWYRPLPARAVEGGTDGKLSPEAATAKKKEIAAGLRDKASKAAGNDKLLGLMESLCYEADTAATEQVNKLSAEWLTAAAASKGEEKKGEIMQMRSAFNYLTKHKFLPDTHPAKAGIAAIIKERGWDEKK